MIPRLTPKQLRSMIVLCAAAALLLGGTALLLANLNRRAQFRSSSALPQSSPSETASGGG